MTHPDLEHAVALGGGKVLDPLEKLGVAVGTNFGVAEFACGTGLNLAAQLIGHGLHAVADPQYWHAELKHRLGRLVVNLVDAGMRARQDDAFELPIGGEFTHPVAAHIAWVHLAKHVGFTHAAGDQLRDLGAKV